MAKPKSIFKRCIWEWIYFVDTQNPSSASIALCMLDYLQLALLTRPTCPVSGIHFAQPYVNYSNFAKRKTHYYVKILH
jgi:hypothetical protein